MRHGLKTLRINRVVQTVVQMPEEKLLRMLKRIIRKVKRVVLLKCRSGSGFRLSAKRIRYFPIRRPAAMLQIKSSPLLLVCLLCQKSSMLIAVVGHILNLYLCVV